MSEFDDALERKLNDLFGPMYQRTPAQLRDASNFLAGVSWILTRFEVSE